MKHTGLEMFGNTESSAFSISDNFKDCFLCELFLHK